MITLLSLLRRSAFLAALGALLGLVSGLCSAWLVIRVQALLVTPEAPRRLLLVIGLLVATLLTTMGAQILIQSLAIKALRELQVELAGRILRAPLRKLETIGTARLLAAQLQDAQVITVGLGVLPMLLSSTVVLIVCFGFLATRSFALLSILLAVTLVMVGVLAVTGAAARRSDQRGRDYADELIGAVHYMIEGSKELKMDRDKRARFLAHELESASIKQEKTFLRTSGLLAFSGNLGRTLLFVAVIAIAVVGRMIEVPPAEVATFGFVILYTSGSLGFALGAMPSLIRSAVALRAVRRLGLELDAEPESSASPGPPNSAAIALRGVSHRYQREDGTAFTLGPLDLEVHPGEILFLTGGNGSGKSTLVKLLTGLYQSESGEIRIGDAVVTPELVPWYREHFGVVFYDYALPTHVELLARPEADALLSELGLGHLTQRSRRIASRQLSSGQRRRLALYVALQDERPIFVFDEWASDQDPTFKEYFYRTILPSLRARGKAVVVVSHDDRYYDIADQLVRLENGQATVERSNVRVKAQGTERSKLAV